VTLAAQTDVSTTVARQLLVMQRMTTMPLAFTENRGQWDSRVLFQARMHGMTIWFTRDGVYYHAVRRIPAKGDGIGEMPGIAAPRFRLHLGEDMADSVEQHVIRSSFEGANTDPSVVGEGLMEYKCNYFLGNDPAKWRTDVPNYSRIVYHELYPGIDLAFYGKNGVIEYDFIVHPGTDPSAIALRYDGVQSTSIDREGNLVLVTPWGELTHCLPQLYEVSANGERVPTSGGFCISEDGLVRFDIPERNDPALAMVIDPVLSYSTYLAGGSDEAGYGIAVDGSGNAYITGYTWSTDFPIVGSYQADQTSTDAFVTKLNSAGNGLVYSTYLGGNTEEAGNGIAVDASGSTYITGYTSSTDFPTVGPYQTDQGGTDVFVTKLIVAGNALVYSTYLGGSSEDNGYGIAVDGDGNAYVAGVTSSADFPTQSAYDASYNGGGDGSDAFVSKLNPAGNALVYSTYLGGEVGDDCGVSIAVDTSENAYVTGSTESTDFPTVGPYQTDQGSADAFVTKLSVAGTALVYSTYLGGGDMDRANGIAVGGSGNAYVTGITSSSDFPTLSALRTDLSGLDAFVTKMNSAGNALEYSTYLGGSGAEQGYSIAVDGSGSAYVTGYTYSTDFPTVDPYQTDRGGVDAFMARLSVSGNTLLYSSYLGGGDEDYGRGIAVDGNGNAYITGTTYSTDFPTVGPYQTDQASTDVFVARFELGVVDVFEPQSPVPPSVSALWQNVPNPFNASTIIRFSLKTGGAAELGIYNILGQRVSVHRESDLQPGTYSYEWNGRDDAGRDVPSGVYLCRLTTQRFTQTRKMTLLK